MPNWCSNSLVIYGPKQDRDRLLEAATDENGDIAFSRRLIPMPDGLTETRTSPNGETYEVFVEGGANWQYDNWGTKWGDSDTHLSEHGDLYTNAVYNTPWGPITQTWLTVSKQYPTLVFVENYDEPGMCFMGGTRIANGEVVAEHYINDGNYPSLEDDEDGETNWDAFYDAIDTIRTEVEDAVDLSGDDIRLLAGVAAPVNSEEDSNV